MSGIKAIDKTSIHRITSGQVVIDLQTAIKELLENSIDAGATNIEIRFKNYGLASIEVVDNGSGIAGEDYDSIALKHHTSKLETYTDLTTVTTFGFRGEALSSLCALSEELLVSTATSTTAPQGVTLTMDSHGKVKSKITVARTQGTTITTTNLFKPLPVRRKEFERNVKREFGKALSLLNAYAIGPCSEHPGIRLTVSNQPEKGSKSVQIRTLGEPSSRAAVSALWGPKSLDDIVDMNLTFKVENDRATLKRMQSQNMEPISVQVKGLISKFAPSCGRTGTDRQFFYVNGRPCNMNKIQKAFNEVYRSFNATQSPFILANFLIPTESYDVNVSPDKRTILLHSEGNLLTALKVALEEHFAPTRAMFDVGGGGGTQGSTRNMIQTLLTGTQPQASSSRGIARGKAKDEQSRGTPSPADVQMTVSQSTTPIRPSPPILTGASQRLNTSSNSPQTLDGDRTNHHFQDEEDMDVSRVGEANSQPEAITVNTLHTTWGRQILSSPIPSPPTLPSLPDLDNDTVEPSTPPRKKRKSDLGTAITRRGSSVYPQTENDDSISKDVGHQMTRTSAVSLNAQNGWKTVTPPTQANFKTTHNIRKQLASFARTGSQLASSSSAAVHSEEEDGDNEDHDQALKKEGRVKEGAETEREEEFDELDPMQDDDIESQTLVTAQNERISKKKSSVTESPHTPEPDTNPIENLEPETESLGHANVDDEADDIEDPDSLLSQVRESSSATPSTISQKNKPLNPEIIKTDKDGGDVLMRFDVDRIKNVWSRKSQLKEAWGGRDEAAQARSVPVDAGISNTVDDAKAVDALARVIEKQDFAGMDIVGQFNLGFIIVRRHQRSSMTSSLTSATTDGAVLDDLFIVDQHAADEKYNFENLQATTKFESQKLLRPRPLELTASDEMLALENLDVLQQNGFDIDVDEDSPVGQGSRLKLVAQPVNKSTVFGMKDLEEIVHLMRDRPRGQMVRCSKARTMFASRACRKSVMVGMPLNQHQMTTVVRHMGTIDQPWNCPHGRPTMRHLSDIRATGSRAKEHIDWSSIY